MAAMFIMLFYFLKFPISSREPPVWWHCYIVRIFLIWPSNKFCFVLYVGNPRWMPQQDIVYHIDWLIVVWGKWEVYITIVVSMWKMSMTCNEFVYQATSRRHFKNLINFFHQNKWWEIKVNCLWSPVINFSGHTTGVKMCDVIDQYF